MTDLGKGAPTVTEMLVIPVAGEDSMLLNLSGAHGPLFTRNIVILRDNAGHTGAGEVPGGERIRQTLEERALWSSGNRSLPSMASSTPCGKDLPFGIPGGAANRLSTFGSRFTRSPPSRLHCSIFSDSISTFR